MVSLGSDGPVVQRVVHHVRMAADDLEIIDFSSEEYRVFLDTEVRRALDLGLDEFRRAYAAGELDDDDPEVERLVVLVGLE